MNQVSDVVDTLRLSGLKGQRALSPGYHPGCWGATTWRPARAKAFSVCVNAFALAGREYFTLVLPRVIPWAKCLLPPLGRFVAGS